MIPTMTLKIVKTMLTTIPTMVTRTPSFESVAVGCRQIFVESFKVSDFFKIRPQPPKIIKKYYAIALHLKMSLIYIKNKQNNFDFQQFF